MWRLIRQYVAALVGAGGAFTGESYESRVTGGSADHGKVIHLSVRFQT
jgi:hypothetical protein